MQKLRRRSLLEFTILFVLSVFGVYWNATNFVFETSIGHNALANLYVAAGPIRGWGLPYRDLWDIYPPGTYVFFGVLEYFTSGNPYYFKLIHFFMQFLFSFSGALVLRKLVHGWIGLLFALVFLVLLNSYFLNSILFGTALIGSAAAAVGFVFLLYSNKRPVYFYISSCLMAFSGLIKDPFLFLMFMPMLVAVIERRWLLVVSAFMGVVSLTGAVVVYSSHFGFLQFYSQVLDFKRTAFNIFGWNQFNPLAHFQFFSEYLNLIFLAPHFLLVAILGFFMLKLQRKDFTVSNSGVAFLLYFLASYLGFKLQGRFTSSYSLQMTFPLLLVLGMLACFWLKEKKGKFRTLSLLTILLGMVPDPRVFQAYLDKMPVSISRFVAALQNNGEEETKAFFDSIPVQVRNALDKTDHILWVYGWGSPVYLYMLKKSPTSKYFIVHPQILNESMKSDWANDVLNKKPKIVHYSVRGADMNVEDFEQNYLNLGEILNKDYLQYGEFYLRK